MKLDEPDDYLYAVGREEIRPGVTIHSVRAYRRDGSKPLAPKAGWTLVAEGLQTLQGALGWGAK